MELSNVDKACKLLRYLSQGNTIVIENTGFGPEGATFAMTEDNDIGVIMKKYKHGEDYTDPSKGEEVLMEINDFRLSDFIDLASYLTEKDMIVMSANMILTKERQRGK